MNNVYEAMKKHETTGDSVFAPHIIKDYAAYAISLLNAPRLLNGNHPDAVMMLLVIYPDLQRKLFNTDQINLFNALKTSANQKAVELNQFNREERTLLEAVRFAPTGKDT